MSGVICGTLFFDDCKEYVTIGTIIPVSGETNDGANVGGGPGEVYRDKTGATLNFRTLEGVGNVDVQTVGDKILIDITSALDGDIKSGTVIPGAFSGTPKTATVTFGTAFPSAAYAVTLSPEVQNNNSFNLAVENKTASGFDIRLNTNNLADLVKVGWHAIVEGE